MKINFLKTKKDTDQQTKPRASKLQKEEKPASVKRENSLLQIPIPGFNHYSALMKLRIVVSVIFLFITITILLLIFAANNTGMWQISALLFLFGYVMLFLLLLKLFRVKKL